MKKFSGKRGGLRGVFFKFDFLGCQEVVFSCDLRLQQTSIAAQI